MDRRLALSSILGLTGAGATLSWSRFGSKIGGTGAGGAGGPAAPAQPAIRLAGSGSIKAVTLAQVPIGGGGFVTGLDFSADGTRMACRTDVANAYVRDSGDSAWKALFSPLTMRSADYDPLPKLADKADGQGVAGIRIAPSNRDMIFASYYGFIWRSIDGGKSIQRTRLPQTTMRSNSGGQRLYNRTIDIHSRDANRVAVGTWGDGVWLTRDGGEHWDQAPLPQSVKSGDGQPGLYLVAYDPTAADRLYAFVSGVGLFRSDNGGGAFQALPGGPTLCSSMVPGPDGLIYLCEVTATGSGGKVWRYSTAAGWASGTPQYEMQVVAIDPGNPKRLIASNPNGYFVESADAGQTFTSVGGINWKANCEVGWMRGLVTVFPAQIIFDPKAKDRLWIAQGVGVAKVETDTPKYLTEDKSAGIEELCAVSVLCVPGGKTFLTSWDKAFWRVDDLTAYANDFRYPLQPGKKHAASLVAYGSYMDYALDDPKFVVGVMAPSDSSSPGFTADGGDNWTAFKGIPSTGWGNGGCIACSSKTNIILLPSNNGTGVYTLDGGASWSPIKLDGQSPTSGFANAFYVTRKNITADKTRPGTFVLIYTSLMGQGYGNPLAGVWLTRDGGKNWTRTLDGVISVGNHDPAAVRGQGLEERQFWQCQLDYVPGVSGELLYTPHADFAADRFYWSRDDGKTWVEPHPKIRNVQSFGFGKAAPGQSRPAVYFWGEIEKKLGLYASLDWFATVPQLVTRFPSQMLASVSCVVGDPDRFGRAYVGTSCAGWVRVEVEV